MMTIWKYTIRSEGSKLSIPKRAKILDVQGQGGDMRLWVLVEPEAKREDRFFYVVDTGCDLSYDIVDARHVGTVQMGSRVCHVFESPAPLVLPGEDQ